VRFMLVLRETHDYRANRQARQRDRPPGNVSVWV
jgi:hypothetical protein